MILHGRKAGLAASLLAISLRMSVILSLIKNGLEKNFVILSAAQDLRSFFCCRPSNIDPSLRSG
jgi:hypothetical protein